MENNNFSLDCCFEENLGDDSFKGVYTFPIVATGHEYKTKCYYGTENVGAYAVRTCRMTDEVASWGSVDLSECKSRGESANKELVDLDQVRIVTYIYKQFELGAPSCKNFQMFSLFDQRFI